MTQLLGEQMTLPAHKTDVCQSGDVTIHYRLFGRPGKTPILIIHGLSYFSYDWIEIADQLSGDREVVAMDMRGFGDSTWSPSQDYSLDAFAGDIDHLLHHLEWQHVILMGHSMGGRNSVYYSSLHPERIEKLVLVDYSPTNAPEGAKRVTNTVADMPDSFPSVEAAIRYFDADPAQPKVRARYEAYLKPTQDGFIVKRDEAFRQRFRRMRETGERAAVGADLWKVLGEVRCPILVLRGKHSDMFVEENVQKVKATNAGLKLVELDTGHNVGGEDPAGLVREVRASI